MSLIFILFYFWQFLAFSNGIKFRFRQNTNNESDHKKTILESITSQGSNCMLYTYHVSMEFL